MSIELYDKGEVIQQGENVFYLLKHGSKNSFTCPYQSIIDNNFKNKYLMRQARNSNWRVIAYGKLENHSREDLSKTKWNAPTSWIYGVIRFGDKINIAKSLSKRKPKLYESFDEVQREHLDEIIGYTYKNGIDLNNIKDGQRLKTEINYCEKIYQLKDNSIETKNAIYWDLDNL